MRFADKSKEREAARRQWHSWFAWHPVEIESDQIAWLEVVERRDLSPNPFDEGNDNLRCLYPFPALWQYRGRASK